MPNDKSFREKLQESNKDKKKLKNKVKELRSKIDEINSEKKKILNKKNKQLEEKKEKIEGLKEKLDEESLEQTEESKTDQNQLEERLEELREENNRLKEEIEKLRGKKGIVLNSEDELVLNSKMDIDGGIRTKDNLKIEESSEISDSIVAENDIELKNNVVVQGDILSTQGEIDVGDNCEIEGIIEGEGVHLGEGVKADEIKSRGGVVINEDSDTNDVYALGDIELGDEVRVKGDVEYGGELTTGKRVAITDSLMPKDKEKIREEKDMEKLKGIYLEESETVDPESNMSQDGEEEFEKIDFDQYLDNLDMDDELIDKGENILENLDEETVTIDALEEQIEGSTKSEIEKCVNRMCEDGLLEVKDSDDQTQVRMKEIDNISSEKISEEQ